MKRGIGILIVLLVVFAACLGFYALTPHQPSYKGRSLSYWLRQIDDGDAQVGLPWVSWPTNRTDKQTLAADAIRRMGTNAVPYLLHDLTNRDSDLKLKVMALLTKQHWIKFAPPSTNHLHRAAALAFDALGPAAKGAVPDLVGILNTRNSGMDNDAGKMATIALSAIEPEGCAALMELVKSNGWGATCAIWGLSTRHVVVTPEVIQTLLGNLTNNNAGDGSVAAFSLGELGQDPEHVIPALINGLKSKDQGTRWGSAYGLGLFGTNATSAIPALSAQLKDPDATVRNFAKVALKQIDPEAAAKADKK